MKKELLAVLVGISALFCGCDESASMITVHDNECLNSDCEEAENPDAKDSTEGDNNTTAPDDSTDEENSSDDGDDGKAQDDDTPGEPCADSEDCADVPETCDICVDNDKKCDGNELMICRRNDENCLDWEVQEDCEASSKACSSELLACVDCAETCPESAKRCESNSIFECTSDANGCALWKITSTCDSNKHCDESTFTCMNGCMDECSEGQSKCKDNGIYTCQTRENGCLGWALTESCEFGRICMGDSPKCEYACGDDCEPFSIIILPDTQNYTRTANGIYKKQTQWIADNKEKENIRFVIHLGDVTNDNTNTQYKRAIAAHDVLAKSGVPYSIATGNHEYKKGDSGKKYGSRSRTLFGNYFNDKYIKEGFKDSSWFHGFKSTGNMYATFDVGNLKFAVIALEYAPRKDILCWADDLIQTKLKDRYIIITTHGYLTRGATEAKKGKYSDSQPKIDYTPVGATGSGTFKELVSRHSNVIMAAGGHVFGIEHRNRDGNNGNSIHETLVDYQAENGTSCAHAADAGNGWLRQLKIDPKNTKNDDGTIKPNVSAKTISVLSSYQKAGKFYCPDYYDKSISGLDHTYSFVFDFSKPIEYKYSMNNDISFDPRSINSAGSGNQINSSIAVNRATGAFVAVWEDDSSAEDGDGNHDIAARIFCAGGCQNKAQFVVNATTNGQQRKPDVAMDRNGNFVVVWEDDNDGNGTYQIYMRGFDAKGNVRFDTKTVNSESAGQQYTPAVAMSPDGNFVVAWHDQSVSKDTPQVYIRGFNADGTERFHDRNVMDSVKGTRKAPDIAMADDGTFVVTWQDDSDGNGYYEIHAKGFEANGQERLKAFVVNTKSEGQQLNPSVGMNASGTFFIAYEDDNDKNGKYLIKARGFDKSGKEIFKDQTLAKSGEETADPVACVADDNKAVFGWTAKALNANDIQCRVVTANMEIASESTVNYPKDGPQKSPALGCTGNGKYVFLFTDDDDQNGSTEIFGRGYNN